MPLFSPASLAALPGSTSVTTTPWVFSSKPNCFAVCGVRSVT